MAIRYAINMDDGRIVPMTSETLNNYIYQEIDAEVAVMVDKGELDAKYVIGEIQKKLPKETLRQQLAKVAKQNVRQADFGLKEAARASVDMGESKIVKIDLPKRPVEEKPSEKPAEEKPSEKDAPKKQKVNL
jgi:hypothetical protein